MAPVFRVALLIDANNPQGREILEGLAGFRAAGPSWSVYLCAMPAEGGLAFLRSRQWEGAVVQVRTAADPRELADAGIPLVMIHDAPGDPPQQVGTVGIDQHAVGRAAGEHFVGLGLRQATMAQRADGLSGQSRRAGFVEALRQAEVEMPEQLVMPSGLHATEILQRMSQWLAGLPKPVGIFASDDFEALHILEAARRSGLSAPDEVAVLGANDDELLTKLADPQLSSVQAPWPAVGFAAAQMLQTMMDGRVPEDYRRIFAPTGVTARGSTDILTVADRELAQAIRFIRERAHTPIQVVDVLEKVLISRRSLERRFRQYLGRSPQQEIQRVRLELAKTKLAESDLPIHEVAAQSGFHDPDRMAAVFRAVIGMSPSEYRAQFRRR